MPSVQPQQGLHKPQQKRFGRIIAPDAAVYGTRPRSVGRSNTEEVIVQLVLLLLVLCAATPVSAQSNPEIVYWPASTLRDYSSTLKDRQTGKQTMSASEILSDLGNHKFEILRRDGSGTGELHQNWTDVFIVQGGEATILYGGTIEEARDTGNGEIRGPRHLGGKSQRVSAGDVLVMPPGVAHQTIVEPGKLFFVLIVKVQRK
jgi:mannose-6-phosphate isomerase-like protein (cupin superfamily)